MPRGPILTPWPSPDRIHDPERRERDELTDSRHIRPIPDNQSGRIPDERSIPGDERSIPVWHGPCMWSGATGHCRTGNPKTLQGIVTMAKIRNALTLPLAQSVAGMMTDGQWAMDDGLFSDVMESHSIAEASDDDLPDPATMDWECPYWDDPDVDDDLLIAARLHREHRLSLGLED